MTIPWDAELGLYEPGPDDPLWWLTFSAGAVFLGALVIQAPTASAAVTRSHKLKLNPGGEVAVIGPIPVAHIGPRWRDRLLGDDDIQAMPAPGTAP